MQPGSLRIRTTARYLAITATSQTQSAAGVLEDGTRQVPGFVGRAGGITTAVRFPQRWVFDHGSWGLGACRWGRSRPTEDSVASTIRTLHSARVTDPAFTNAVHALATQETNWP